MDNFYDALKARKEVCSLHIFRNISKDKGTPVYTLIIFDPYHSIQLWQDFQDVAELSSAVAQHAAAVLTPFQGAESVSNSESDVSQFL